MTGREQRDSADESAPDQAVREEDVYGWVDFFDGIKTRRLSIGVCFRRGVGCGKEKQALRRELADCAALGITLGDAPTTDLERAVVQEFGYVDDDGNLTDEGWDAAGDAMGFVDV